MMNAFFRRAFSEYKRQKKLKRTFVAQTARLGSVLRDITGKTKFESESSRERADFRARASLLVLMPLVEIAWADGRVTRREMDAIKQAADAYGLFGDEAGYRELVERLLSRPIPNEVGRMWQDFHYFMENLSRRERETVIFALLAQAQFVSEQSAENVIGFLRGERISAGEREALRLVAVQLEKASRAAEESEIEKHVAAQIEKEKLYEAAGVFSEQVKDNVYAEDKLPASEKTKNPLDETERRKMVDTLVAVEIEIYQARKRELFGADDGDGALDSAETKPVDVVEDSKKLIPIIPLVKVAWAEGRITRRERELIFNAAERMGIEAGSPAHERLAGWLELHPTADFYTDALERLNAEWDELAEEEKVLRRLDLLSDCVQIAEASGGTSRYPAGGRRVCDEEFAAVKRIAQKLNVVSNPAETTSLAA